MRHDAEESCLAYNYNLTSGSHALPGGRIYETSARVVEAFCDRTRELLSSIEEVRK